MNVGCSHFDRLCHAAVHIEKDRAHGLDQLLLRVVVGLEPGLDLRRAIVHVARVATDDARAQISDTSQDQMFLLVLGGSDRANSTASVTQGSRADSSTTWLPGTITIPRMGRPVKSVS